MLKNDSLTAAAFVLSLLAILFSVANFNFSPSTDAFVGIMAGLIGVCATIMVGFQIFNSVDTRNKLKEIEKMQLELKKELQLAKKERKNSELLMNAGISHCYGLSLSQKQPFTAYDSMFTSISYAVEANNPTIIKNYVTNIIALTELIEDLISKDEIIDNSDIESVESLDFNILAEFPAYTLIQDSCLNAQNSINDSIKKIK